jgi:hypothetical protein
MSLAAALVNRIWLAAQLPAYRHYRAALAEPRRCQEAILRRYLTANAATEFGMRHGFARIRSLTDFQRNVPLSTFDDYSEAVEQIGRGERDVLSASPVRMLEPSSGSTSARKLVPYTAALQAEFRRAIAPWLIDLVRTLPSLRNGRSYWSITPAQAQPQPQPECAFDDERAHERPHETEHEHERECDGKTEHRNVPVGFDSDAAYLGGWLAWLTSRALLDCKDLGQVRDLSEFRRLTLLRLLAARDLRLISVWHPTFFSLLLDELEDRWPVLLRDLATGVAPRGASRGIPASARRARELGSCDPRVPASIWPKLALLSCWGDGHAARDCSALARRIPRVVVQSKGLLATEACVSIPFAGQKPLAIRSHLFEFLDVNENAKMSWELELGESYSVVVTTGGGFYRYRLRDRVMVDGFVEATPSIRFVGKEDSMSDLCGEKLSEAFVADILERLLRALAPDAVFAMLAPSMTSARPRYLLFLESELAHGDELQAALESELARNPNYAHCVRLGQIEPVGVLRVGRDAAARYVDRMQIQGRRLGAIKPVALSPLMEWEQTLACRR